ncbi:MAG: FadR family transcriptional regulator [Saprospiraceae bacterium]|nr:FadR family transcriptional regulator [Saprospiraceae bacterium]
MGTLGLRAKIKSVDHSSLVDQVEENLIDYLIDNNFKAGDALPKEIELASTLQVSRTVVREALLRLRMIGLVESKKKRGAVLTNPDLMAILEKSLIPKLLDEVTLKNLFEFRLVLEIGMADLIMAKVSKKDIDELKEIVAIEPEATEDFKFNIDHEIRFHGELYEITGNENMKKFQKLLMPVFAYVHQSDLLRKPEAKNKYVSHTGLVHIIENGSAEMLRNGMRNHLENQFSRLF